ncbi:hypothetical protein [Allokutzneria sp. NRRL B-24872]|uniref:hypothetical protein n=1 Tax=Allokutzneria sp. NRRL B-24872 TaxID=1137961 RepID=UPI000A37FCE4|nr:hypothetical protein [Allokutzneria sp. NRRL B-24872]
MNRKRIVLIAVALVAVVVAVLAWLGVFNRLFGDGYSAPACEQLPTRAEATQAMSRNGGLAQKLAAVGPGVEVAVSTPCSDSNRALVVVRVGTGEEEAAARSVLRESDGFGVPATVERR